MDEIGKDEILKLKREKLKARLLGLPESLSEEEKEAIKKWEISLKIKEDEKLEAISQYRSQYSLDINDIELPWKPKTDSHYSTPTQFLIEVNKFQDYIERYFLHEEIFGEFGEKFPIESYMRIYDMIKLQQSKFKFRCAYTHDGLGGWLNILAVNQSKAISIYTNIKLFFSSDNKEPTKVDFKERWSRREESLSRLRMLLDSLSAKDKIYTSFSELGCLQYLHFINFSEAFAFEWHSLPRRKYVLTSISEIQKIYENLKRPILEGEIPYRFKFDEDKLENLLKIFKSDEDLKPSIVMYDNKCSIEWIEFHTHSGIFQRRYEIDKSLMPCKSLDDISNYAVPTNVRLVSDIDHLNLSPLFRY